MLLLAKARARSLRVARASPLDCLATPLVTKAIPQRSCIFASARTCKVFLSYKLLQAVDNMVPQDPNSIDLHNGVGIQLRCFRILNI